MIQTPFLETMKRNLQVSPKRYALSVEIRRFLADEGASQTEQDLADAIATKIYACKCDAAQFVPTCWQLLKCTNQLFFEYLTCDQQIMAALEMPQISTYTEELSLVATARWLESATRAQTESLILSPQETAIRLAAQYKQYLAILRRRGMPVLQAVSFVHDVELSEIRAALGECLLQPIINRPNGLFNTSLACKPQVSLQSKNPKAGVQSRLPIAPRAAMGSRSSHRFSDPNPMYNSSRASILGAPPLMRAMVSQSVQNRM